MKLIIEFYTELTDTVFHYAAVRHIIECNVLNDRSPFSIISLSVISNPRHYSYSLFLLSTSFCSVQLSGVELSLVELSSVLFCSVQLAWWLSHVATST